MKKLSPIDQEAKLKVLQECMDSMDGMMGEGLDKKKAMKATVIAPDKSGLEKGLEKAADVVEGEGDSDIMGGDHIMDESEDMESEDEMEMSPEQIEEKIQELQMLLKMKSKKSDVKIPF